MEPVGEGQWKKKVNRGLCLCVLNDLRRGIDEDDEGGGEEEDVDSTVRVNGMKWWRGWCVYKWVYCVNGKKRERNVIFVFKRQIVCLYTHWNTNVIL